jgi:hypothetical protein
MPKDHFESITRTMATSKATRALRGPVTLPRPHAPELPLQVPVDLAVGRQQRSSPKGIRLAGPEAGGPSPRLLHDERPRRRVPRIEIGLWQASMVPGIQLLASTALWEYLFSHYWLGT